MGERGGGSDVDADGEVEKVNPRLECERNEGNGGVFLWLGRERERRWRIGRERAVQDLRHCNTLPPMHSLPVFFLHFHSSSVDTPLIQTS